MMNMFAKRCVSALLYSLTALSLYSDPTASRSENSQPIPPPTAPPVVAAAADDLSEPYFHSAATLYSIGEPTPEEQLYLEFLNRARANPTNEAALFASTSDPAVTANYETRDWTVNLTEMQRQFSLIPPAPPIAFNANLIAAARRHSTDMFNNVFQDHVGTDQSTFADRISATGYKYSTSAENIFSYAQSVFSGHAGFEVDWGPGPFGMQTPAGHRANIHNPAFREIGVGVVLGRNSAAGKDEVGPQVVTQDFGTRQGSTPLITGVAYYDLNGNNFYDVGEGIGGVSVKVAGGSSEAVTARSGGYAVPVSGNGTYNVTFSGPGFADVTRSVVINTNQNQKIDFIPAYNPPTLAGPISPAVARANNYNVSVVGGATAYQWRVIQTTPATPEGAERGNAKLAISQTGTYDVIQGSKKASGSFAFHLAMPDPTPASQYITLSPNYLVNSGGSISFQSELGWAAPDQHAQVQISTDGGAHWEAVFNQDGNNTAGETSFRTRTVDLTAFVGKTIRIRFAYRFDQGRYYSNTDIVVGWLIDDIQLANLSEIVSEQVSDVSGSAFDFEPSAAGTYILQTRAKTGHDFLDWGPPLNVAAAIPSEFRIGSIQTFRGTLLVNVQITSGPAPANMVLETTTGIGTSWKTETALPKDLGNSTFSFTTAIPTTGAKFFRVRTN